jgi:catechol 2,3-dioxygenase-like lactoylglutathione lyase family enzyme
LKSERYKGIKPSKLAHVVLRSAHFQESRPWYEAVLGAKAVFENELLTFMTYDDEHHRIGIVNAPGSPERGPQTAGVEHFAFTFETLDALLAKFLELKAGGIVPYWTINHGPTISLYYRDPDGNKVELQYDVFPTGEEAQAFLTGPAYRENFMGITFDPDQMAARWEAGESLQALTRRPPLPPGVTPFDMARPNYPPGSVTPSWVHPAGHDQAASGSVHTTGEKRMSTVDLTFADRLEIETLMNEIVGRRDRGEGRRVSELFVEDGEIVTPHATMKDRAAIHEYFSDPSRSATLVTRHLWANMTMTPLADGKIRVDSYAMTMVGSADAPEKGVSMMIGNNQDIFVRMDGRWLFARREVTHALRGRLETLGAPA